MSAKSRTFLEPGILLHSFGPPSPRLFFYFFLVAILFLVNGLSTKIQYITQFSIFVLLFLTTGLYFTFTPFLYLGFCSRKQGNKYEQEECRGMLTALVPHLLFHHLPRYSGDDINSPCSSLREKKNKKSQFFFFT